jgi:hypothetical protein
MQEELTEGNLLEKEAKQQLGDETAELELAAGWQDNVTEEENDMGDRVYLPTDKCGKDKEVQPIRLHKENHPLEQLDRVIKDIRKLMLRSTKVVSKGGLHQVVLES